MLGVNSSKRMARPPCPFQDGDQRCGADTVLYDREHTMVRCRRGHLSSVSSLPGPVGGEARPLLYRQSFPLRVDPRDVLLAVFAIDLLVRHL